MKYGIVFVILCSLNANAGIVSSIKDKIIGSFGTTEKKIERGLLQPSTACVSIIKERGYTIDTATADGCNQIKTLLQYQCAKELASYSELSPAAIKACSAFNDKNSLTVLKSYTGTDSGTSLHRYDTPRPATILIFAAVNTQNELACVKNLLEVGSFTVQELEEKCIEDTDLELDQREFKSLGFVLSPRTFEYGKKDAEKVVKHIWDSIFK
jgi:hypothetical protein